MELKQLKTNMVDEEESGDLKTQMANYKEKISKLYEKKFKSLKKNLDHEFQEKLSLQKYNFH